MRGRESDGMVQIAAVHAAAAIIPKKSQILLWAEEFLGQKHQGERF
jgi:hypothetical protein